MRVSKDVHEGKWASGVNVVRVNGFEVTSEIRNGLLSRPAWTENISNFILGEEIHFLKKNPGLKEGLALVLVWPWLCACLLNLTLHVNDNFHKKGTDEVFVNLEN